MRFPITFHNILRKVIFPMKKRLLPLMLVLLLLLPACSEKEPVYRTDLSAQQISDACGPILSAHSLLAPADEDYIKFRLLPNGTGYESCAVYIQNAGTSIDEFGIVKAPSDDTATLEAAIADYLSRRNEEWTGQYLVEEYPKLRDASYKAVGRYVVYAILSEEDKAAFFSAAEQFITEE